MVLQMLCPVKLLWIDLYCMKLSYCLLIGPLRSRWRNRGGASSLRLTGRRWWRSRSTEICSRWIKACMSSTWRWAAFPSETTGWSAGWASSNHLTSKSSPEFYIKTYSQNLCWGTERSVTLRGNKGAGFSLMLWVTSACLLTMHRVIGW